MSDHRQLALSLLLAAVAATSCVSHRMYRETSVAEHLGYSLDFIEFDDQGEVWSPCRFYELQDLICTVEQIAEGVLGEEGVGRKRVRSRGSCAP